MRSSYTLDFLRSHPRGVARSRVGAREKPSASRERVRRARRARNASSRPKPPVAARRARETCLEKSHPPCRSCECTRAARCRQQQHYLGVPDHTRGSSYTSSPFARIRAESVRVGRCASARAQLAVASNSETSECRPQCWFVDVSARAARVRPQAAALLRDAAGRTTPASPRRRRPSPPRLPLQPLERRNRSPRPHGTQ
jgi:hypothetical protein